MYAAEMWLKGLCAKALLMVAGGLILWTGNAVIESILGILLMAAGIYFAFWRGQIFGHKSCAVSKTIQTVEEEHLDLLDDVIYSRTWSKRNGYRTFLLGALIPLAVSAVYVLAAFLGVHGVWKDVLRWPAQLATLPFLPLASLWGGKIAVMTPGMAVLLLLSTIILPLSQLIGYLQGPKLWLERDRNIENGRGRDRKNARINLFKR